MFLYNFAINFSLNVLRNFQGQKMQIIPAIDLKEGCVVRLMQGKMESAKIYYKNPLEVVKIFEEMGAEYLHIVDLDGAFCGKPQNKAVIENIAKNSTLKIEIGGGIRNEETIKEYLNLGVNRIILGSIALKDPKFAKEMAQKYPIIIGIDAKDGKVATEGWDQVGRVLASEFAKEFQNSPIEAIICTDISNDGMLNGINIDFTKEIAQSSGKFTLASGGLSCLEDLEKLYLSKIDGVIAGKAFYEKKLDLKEAFRKFK